MRLADRFEQARKWPLQLDANGTVIGCLEAFHGRTKRLAEGVPLAPSQQACRAILRADRRVVVEGQSRPQADQPRPPVIGHGCPRRHLGLRLQLRIDAVQRVEHAVSVLDRDGSGREHRVQDREVGLRNEAQHPRIGRPGRSTASRARPQRPCWLG